MKSYSHHSTVQVTSSNIQKTLEETLKHGSFVHLTVNLTSARSHGFPRGFPWPAYTSSEGGIRAGARQNRGRRLVEGSVLGGNGGKPWLVEGATTGRQPHGVILYGKPINKMGGVSDWNIYLKHLETLSSSKDGDSWKFSTNSTKKNGISLEATCEVAEKHSFKKDCHRLSCHIIE